MELSHENNMEFMRNKLVLAPLVGGSDLSFRLLARKYGAQVTYTEMCVAETYLAMNPAKRYKNFNFAFDTSDRPLILQLAGKNADAIIRMANSEEFAGKIDAVDLNCGCPQSFAMKKKIGAGLLETPDHLVEMIAQIVPAIRYPLSVKIRLYRSVEKTIELVHRIITLGVRCITVHGREWWQKGDKRGLNDWDAIGKIKATFPECVIVGNGDVKTFADFERFKMLSGVDSVMSGYGALCSPSIFSAEFVSKAVEVEAYLTIARNHKQNWINVLRHVGWILKSWLADPLRKQYLYNHIHTMASLLNYLEGISICVKLPDDTPDLIDYPKKLEDMSPKELKKHNRNLRLLNKSNQDGVKEKFKETSKENSDCNIDTRDVFDDFL